MLTLPSRRYLHRRVDIDIGIFLFLLSCISLLEDVESHVDRTSDRLRNAMKKVVYILKKEEGEASTLAY